MECTLYNYIYVVVCDWNSSSFLFSLFWVRQTERDTFTHTHVFTFVSHPNKKQKQKQKQKTSSSFYFFRRLSPWVRHGRVLHTYIHTYIHPSNLCVEHFLFFNFRFPKQRSLFTFMFTHKCLSKYPKEDYHDRICISRNKILLYIMFIWC